MTPTHSLPAALLLILVWTSACYAQPASTAETGASAAMNAVPEACHKAMQGSPMAGRMQNMPMMSADQMPGPTGMSETGRGLMAAMRKMNPSMMMGAMADTPELAFLCSMIPHHQGAIDMARAALKTTKSEAVRKVAEKTIKENEDGIKEMTKLLEQETK
jgi:uncharacterized protein (DUF305 family)